MMDVNTGLGLVALMGAAATIAGAAEDLESDIGSQSNPNSQVQLAPQVGVLHRIFNKAISGEPPAYAFYSSIAATVAWILMNANFNIIAAFAIGAFVASIFHGIYASTAYMGRIASQRRYGQPIYLDVIYNHLPPIMAHGFVATFCILGLSYILWHFFEHPFPFVMLAFIWGITVGAIGSSTGDVHYGSEREYQNKPFGSGLNAALSGKIVTKAEIGTRSSIDNAWFCAKFGGPATGITFGLIVFLDNWRTLVFDQFMAIVVGFVIVALLIVANWLLEVWARKSYGPYPEKLAMLEGGA
ncbi:MAG: tetrahydromethanopterin S-methyltransferase subunit E [Archaeoglobi archaeon]|jgi:tetrahydromethanopterin S-methyltransferase subunit E|nr:MAG: tetrahydromethanopterin S-methyltransferase subunit E [Archaeoglobi archaeon]TDA30825.1 MAG: tetrahydromethanopterin S-methyltransferase subunit E [Archaeoglobi archaeon]